MNLLVVDLDEPLAFALVAAKDLLAVEDHLVELLAVVDAVEPDFHRSVSQRSRRAGLWLSVGQIGRKSKTDLDILPPKWPVRRFGQDPNNLRGQYFCSAYGPVAFTAGLLTVRHVV